MKFQKNFPQVNLLTRAKVYCDYCDYWETKKYAEISNFVVITPDSDSTWP